MASPPMSNVDTLFSPSTLHHRLADTTRPALAYRGGELHHWQTQLRRKLRALLGSDQMPQEQADLEVRSLWQREHPHGTIEKFLFSSEPGVDVPCYLCLPHDAQRPLPVFICLQGHSTGMHNSIGVAREDERTPIDIEGDRDFANGCLKRGIAALCIEQRALGERREQQQASTSPQACHDAAMQAMMLGRTLIGERVHDVQRAVDVLTQHTEIDAQRIGIMGNSGGGTATIYAAALLPQIRWAMPSCALCAFRDSIMRIHHCSCNYVPHILRYADIGDIMGLFAPRPVVVVAGREDPIFPFPGVQAAYGQLHAIYRAAGAEGRCRLVVGEGGHRFYEDQAWDAMMPFIRASA